MASRREHDGLVARARGVKTLRTDELEPNPHNPRLLFDEQPLKVLRESIAKVGILVPLTVYLDRRRGKYVILDGQRRWICAQAVGLKEVPVNEVEEPSLVQNIVTMFQIHKLREDWQLMPTALKLQVLMEELQERSETKLAVLTGLDKAVVVRCKKLLSYPKRYQDRMLDPDPKQRVKADFFIELYPVRNDRFVNKMPWFRRDSFTSAMLKRHLEGKLRSVTEFRAIKEHISNARKAGKKAAITRRLREFAEDMDLGVEHLAIASATAVKAARAIQRQAAKLRAEIGDLDVESFLGEEALWVSLEELAGTIKKKLAEAGRRARG